MSSDGYLFKTFIFVCLSELAEIDDGVTGDRRDMRDGVNTWMLGAGHSLLLSVLGSRGGAAARAQAETDLWVPGPGPDPGQR